MDFIKAFPFLLLYACLVFTLFCFPVAIALRLITKTRRWALTVFLVPAGAGLAGALLIFAWENFTFPRPELRWGVWQAVLGIAMVFAMATGVLGGFSLAKRLRDGARMQFPVAVAAGVIVAFVGWSYLTASRVSNDPRKAILGNLGSLRSALDLYKQDHGTYPLDFSALTAQQKYLISVPEIPLRPRSASVKHVSSAVMDGAGGWAYVNDPISPDFGKLMINLSGTDSRGVSWSSY